MLSKKKYFRAIAFMLMVTTYLPVVFQNLPRGIGSFHFYAIIWFASLLFYYSRLFVNKFFILYGLVFMGVLLNTLWLDLNDWNRGIIIMEFYFISVAVSVLLYFRMVGDYKGLAWLVKWSLIFIGITAIMSIYSASVNPMYARSLSGHSEWTLDEKAVFVKLGGGAYGFASALIALFPIIVYYYRNNKFSIFSKNQLLIYGLLIFFTLLKLQFFANVLLSTIVIIVALLGANRMSYSLVVISVFFIISFAIPVSIYADLLTSISSFFDPDSNIYYKLNDFAEYIVNGDRFATGAGARVDRFPLLLNSFIENPLLGRFVGKKENILGIVGQGGHLYWMNKLTTLGILGFIPYVLVHTGYVKSVIRYFNKGFTFYFLLAIFSVVGLGLIKVLIGREIWFMYFILLPGTYFFPLLKKKD